MKVGDQFYYQRIGYIGVAEIRAVHPWFIEAGMDGMGLLLPQDFEAKDPAFRGWVNKTAIPAPSLAPTTSVVAASKTYYYNGAWVTPEDTNACPDCKTQTEHKKFNTFEYDYCPKCKKEVDLKATTSAWKGKDYYD